MSSVDPVDGVAAVERLVEVDVLLLELDELDELAVEPDVAVADDEVVDGEVVVVVAESLSVSSSSVSEIAADRSRPALGVVDVDVRARVETSDDADVEPVVYGPSGCRPNGNVLCGIEMIGMIWSVSRSPRAIVGNARPLGRTEPLIVVVGKIVMVDPSQFTVTGADNP